MVMVKVLHKIYFDENIKEWLEDNVGKRKIIKNSVAGIIPYNNNYLINDFIDDNDSDWMSLLAFKYIKVYFKDSDKAMLFKLTWC